MKILQIDSSILGGGSVTRQLGAEVARQLTDKYPGATREYRDLAAAPIHHLTTDDVMARGSEDFSDPVLTQFVEADLVVVGAPMYNYGVPSTVKAWLDRIAVAGVTFNYTAEGPVGLMGAKKVIIISARGSQYDGVQQMNRFEHQESHLKAFFALLGINDVQVIRAEGVAVGEDQRNAAISAAIGHVPAILSHADARVAA